MPEFFQLSQSSFSKNFKIKIIPCGLQLKTHPIHFENQVLSVEDKNTASKCLSLDNKFPTARYFLAARCRIKHLKEKWNHLVQLRVCNSGPCRHTCACVCMCAHACVYTHIHEQKGKDRITSHPHKDKVRQGTWTRIRLTVDISSIIFQFHSITETENVSRKWECVWNVTLQMAGQRGELLKGQWDCN